MKQPITNLSMLDNRLTELEPVLRGYYQKLPHCLAVKADRHLAPASHLEIGERAYPTYYFDNKFRALRVRFTTSVTYSTYRDDTNTLYPNTPYVNLAIADIGLQKWALYNDLIMVDIKDEKRLIVMDARVFKTLASELAKSTSTVNINDRVYILNILNNYCTVPLPELAKIDGLIMDDITYDDTTIYGRRGTFPFYDGELTYQYFNLAEKIKLPEEILITNITTKSGTRFVKGIKEVQRITGIGESSIKQVLSGRQATARDAQGNRWIMMNAKTQIRLGITTDDELSTYLHSLIHLHRAEKKIA